MTVSGLTTLSGGTISGSGHGRPPNGGILLNLTNALFTLDGRTLTNPAGQTATWSGLQQSDRTFRWRRLRQSGRVPRSMHRGARF